MESIYIPAFNSSSQYIDIPPEEVRHLRALRLREGSRLYAVNGMGLAAEIEIESMQKDSTSRARSLRFIENMGEPKSRMAIAFGILADREKNELIVEKAVELGFTEIIPILANRSQRKEVNLQRLNLKAISAMKQCLRSVLPTITAPTRIAEIITAGESYEYNILADIDGGKPAPPSKGSARLFIGPEGGFDQREIESIKRSENSIVWTLGGSRLRAETASIVAMGILSALGAD